MPVLLLSMILLLLMVELLYIRYVKRHNIESLLLPSRAAVHQSAVAGGGFIFYIGASLPLLLCRHEFDTGLWITMGAGALLTAMSLVDDMIKLSPVLRLTIQAAAFGAVLYAFPAQGYYLLYALLIVLCTGYTNASNFMDGINGMLTLYSLAVTCSIIAACKLYSVQPILPVALPSVQNIELMAIGLAIALAVFAPFNVRSKALAFAGDAGSISAGYFISLMLLWLCFIYDDFSLPIFGAVFIIDTFCTFAVRLLKGERVMQPHRQHLYQLLAAAGIPQLKISAGYAAVQLTVNALWLIMPAEARYAYFFLAATCLIVVYFVIKRRYGRLSVE